MQYAIRAEGLGKRYRIGLAAERHETLRDALAAAIKAPVRNFSRLRKLSRFQSDEGADVIWALRDVTFDVSHGEVVGVIGRNGAGKSTLLKVLSRVTEPTRGRAVVQGRVGSLLEVGTGFHPELTGRDNVYLNGSILGMDRAAIDRRFEEIVEFAGVGKFIDTPVKRYSSGMYLRLAFAVAAHLEPEVLVVDEVLAVGDAEFQKKCLGKMGAVAREGRTVMFVSHNMSALQTLCDRAIWIHRGEIRMDGEATATVERYLAGVAEGHEEALLESAGGELVVERVRLRDGAGAETTSFRPGGSLTVEVEYRAPRPLEAPYLWIGIVGPLGPLFGANMLLDGQRPGTLEGSGRIRCTFPELPLLPQQTYRVMLGGRAADGRTRLIPTEDVAHFRMIGTASELGLTGEPAESVVSTSASVVLPYEWELPDGRTVMVDPYARAGARG